MSNLHQPFLGAEPRPTKRQSLSRVGIALICVYLFTLVLKVYVSWANYNGQDVLSVAPSETSLGRDAVDEVIHQQDAVQFASASLSTHDKVEMILHGAKESKVFLVTCGWCPHCRAAKAVLRKMHIPFGQLMLEGDEHGDDLVPGGFRGFSKALQETTGASTVPAVQEKHQNFYFCLKFDEILFLLQHFCF